MATQTPTQRSAAAKRAAATRKRNATKRSASTTRASARRTRGAATGTARSARSTARTAGTTGTRAAETAARGVDAAGTQFGVVTTGAQRVLLTAVGALASAGDAIKRNARTYTDSGRLTQQLDRFERRGARLLSRGGRQVRRRVR
jgi:hypothetical protein